MYYPYIYICVCVLKKKTNNINTCFSKGWNFKFKTDILPLMLSLRFSWTDMSTHSHYVFTKRIINKQDALQ